MKAFSLTADYTFKVSSNIGFWCNGNGYVSMIAYSLLCHGSSARGQVFLQLRGCCIDSKTDL